MEPSSSSDWPPQVVFIVEAVSEFQSVTSMAARQSSAAVDSAARHAEVCGKQSSNLITVYVLPTTGGEMKLQISPSSKVSTLKGVISNRIKLSREKIVLLQKNRQLTEGTLEENHVTDGTRLMLVPCVEAGLLASRPEHSVLKALNTLTDTQVDNVLTGRVPLNLTMRFGGHMMFIQLQLATGTPPPAPPTPSAPPLTPGVFPPTPPTTPTSLVCPSAFPLPATPPASPDRNLKTEPEWPQPNAASENTQTTLNSSKGSVAWPSASDHCSGAASTSSIGGGSVSSHSSSQAAHELALASRHLTQTLKQLSSVALGAAAAASACAPSRATPVSIPDKCQNHHCPRQQNGAVIESLYHHGKGIYSGTFVGTLSPSLQGTDGRPRPNISTIVHILNDLLGASLQCQTTSSGESPGPTRLSCGCVPDLLATPHTPTDSPQQQQGAHPGNVDDERQHENQAIRGKMEQLQNLLEERRQRRKARRQVRSAPYHLLTGSKVNSLGHSEDTTAV